MSGPAYVYYDAHLYSVLPELKEIDSKIGHLSRSLGTYPNDINVLSFFSVLAANTLPHICMTYHQIYSNIVDNGGDPSRLTFLYINKLESAVMDQSAPSRSEQEELLQQKIKILEHSLCLADHGY